MKRNAIVLVASVAMAASAHALQFQPGTTVVHPVTLDLKSVDETTAVLRWVARDVIVDSGGHVPASSYDLRYATDESLPFETMTPVMDELPAPGGEGEVQVAHVTGLEPGTTYWFVMRTIFNPKPATQLPIVADSDTMKVNTTVDAAPPGSIDDLSAQSPAQASVELRWTATGDDGRDGRAAGYEIRYSAAGPILTEEGWAAALDRVNGIAPQLPGEAETFTLSGLPEGGTLFFALRAFDDRRNVGPLSPNSPSVVVLAGISSTGNRALACGGSARAGLSLAVFVAAAALILVRR